MGNQTPLTSRLLSLYDRTVLGHPLLTLLAVALLVSGFISSLHQFRLDASPDTLMLENDQSLAYYRAIKAVYGSDDKLIITYTPKSPLFADGVIDDLRQLHDQLAAIERVESVTSLLNVPLLESPLVTLSEVAEEIMTLEHPRTQRSLAQLEFLNSPL